MRIMLMGRFERQAELAEYAQELTNMGHIVTSRWLTSEGSVELPEGATRYDEKGFSDEYAEASEPHAVVDMQDTIRANCLVLFSEYPTMPVVRGARHVEFGIGIGFNIAVSMIVRLMGDPAFGDLLAGSGVMPKQLIVVGPRENIYHCLSQSVKVYPDWETARSEIGNASSASLAVANRETPRLVSVSGSPL